MKGEPVDVVVPVRSAEGRDYEKLVLCCRAIRRRVPVHRLIVPTANPSSLTRRRISELADVPVFDEKAVGAGLCRSLGLKEVQTEYYASIDADTSVRAEWFPWCIKTIHEPNVAACQGYSRPVSRLLDRFIRTESLTPGRYADLGNTLLRTEVVRAVGMPTKPFMEDHILRYRIMTKGYLWLINPELNSDHLQNELDVLLHRYWYGKFDPRDWLSFCKYTVWLAREEAFRWKRYGTSLGLFMTLADMSFALGSLAGNYPARR